MKSSLNRLAAIAATCTIAFSPLVTDAQNRPAVERVLSRGFVDRTPARPLARLPGAEHVCYGRIATLRGSGLTVLTRGGRLLRVDAADAYRSGEYSEPLFIGKVVALRGYYDTNRTLHAQSVMRMGKLDATTPADR